MKERPILFSAPMVRAILEGKKTVTRRVIKRQPPSELNDGRWYPDRYNGGPQWCWWGKPGTDVAGKVAHHIGQACPYGQPGDRLWVRETWADWEQGTCYRADGTWSDGRQTGHPDVPSEIDRLKLWKPSIHMKRVDSRINLEITSIVPQRLQEMMHKDALAEGVSYDVSKPDGSPMNRFIQLWDSINGKGAWLANPWVWAVSFERITDREPGWI